MNSYGKAVILMIAFTIFVDSLVIYRRKPKPRLICHEEYDDELSSENSSDGDREGYQLTTTSVRVRKPTKTRSKRENDKIKLKFDERVKRMDLQEGDFEIIGESLTLAEKEAIKQKLIQTCHSLNIRSV